MKSVGVVMVTTDKGLCGGLNTNITRVVLSKLKEFEKNGIAVQATAFGNKNLGVLTRIGAKLVSNEVQLGDKPQLDRLLGAIKVQLDAYLEGRIDALYVASTRFVNTMKQEPMFLRLLPGQRFGRSVPDRRGKPVQDLGSEVGLQLGLHLRAGRP